MTKISFDVDFSKDPEKILQEIQERAKAEVEKRESKERNAAYLSKLHEKVNEKIGTEYKSVSDLIRALTPFAAPSLRDKLSGTTASGRRKTISMNKDVYDEVKKLLSEPNPNKAAIARQTGISVVQVRKVADGGFDEKFGSAATTSSTSKTSPKPLPTIEEPNEESLDVAPALPTFKDTEHSPSIEENTIKEPAENNLSDLPTFEDNNEDAPPSPPVDLNPPSAPDLPPATPAFEDKSVSQVEENLGEPKDLLPPLPKFTPAPFVSNDEPTENDASEATPPPLPSFGDEENEAVLPPPIDSTPPPPPVNEEESESVEGVLPPLPNFSSAPLDAPEDSSDDSVPPLPSPSFGEEENDSSLPPPPPAPLAEEEAVVPEEEPVSESEPHPPASEEAASAPPSPPPVAPPPVPSAPTGGLTRPPSGLKPTLKPKLGAGKKGKPTLSLKPKSKTTGLKITRPPMRGNSPPS
jgi:hypothetical protein